MTTENKYFKEASLFLEKLFFELTQLNVSFEKWDIDHLCYRTESLEHYHKIKNDFSLFSDLLIESPVNGRPIATYKLKKAWQFENHFIDLIEVPAPKPNKVTRPGFEHIEVVYPASFADIENTYSQLKFEKNDQHKKFNPELVANLSNGDIKFHHQSLENVIHIEKVPGLLDNLFQEIQLPIETFFITGTIPLNIQNEYSDIDVCFQYQPNQAISILEFIQSFQEWVQNPKLSIKNNVYVFNFIFNNLNFEFYFSPEALFKQNSYVHLLIEQRLLKIFGSNLSQTIKELKKHHHTELAFAKAIGLETNENDAFHDLLKLQNLSDLEIFQNFKHSFESTLLA